MSRTLPLLLTLVAFPSSVFAQSVPDLLDFQGYLRTETGQPVTKTVGMNVSLYDASSGGNLLFSEDLPTVPVYSGRFSIQVGASKLLPAGLFDAHPQVFLGLSIDGSPELPRQQLRTVPYAFRAGSTAAADVAAMAKDLDCPGCVTTAKLSDQSVTAAKLGEPCKEGQFLARVGGVWQCATLPTYSGKDFALSSQACEAGQKVQGLGTDGTLLCGDDEWQAYTAGTGLVLESAKFSLDLAFADGRYVNAGEAGSVTGAMLVDGGVTASKLGEPCKAGEVLKMGPSGWGCAADLDSPVVPGTGLKAAENVLSVDPATIQGWARDVCYDVPVELAEALADWDQKASDDLTIQTVFGGDVSGKHDGLTIGTGKVTDAKIASMSWSKLTGIPPGFADGTDDGTTYTGGAGISIAGTTISIPAGGVTNGMLVNPSLAVTAGTGLTGGGTLSLGGNTTLRLADTAVTPGTYKRATVTVDAQGRLTAASSGPAIDAAADVSGVLPVENGGTGAGTASGARSNLGAAASGVNADITGLARLNTQAAITLLPYGTTANDESEIRFQELAANGTNHVGLKGPDAIAKNVIWTLPAADGVAGQVLRTDGTGDLSWASVGTGSVTQVNSGSGLAGGPITTSGTLSIATGGVTNAMLSNPSLTVTAGSGLSGGGSVSLGGTTTLSIATGGVANAMLSNSSVTMTAGPGLSGGGPVALGGTSTLWIASGGVTNAMLVNPSLTVAAGTGLTGGGTVPLGGTTTIGLAGTGVTAGTYTRATVTVDAQGRLTSASNGGNVALTTDVSGVLPVANGGTGATTASGARAGLGAAASGTNTDITSLAGLASQEAVGIGPYGTIAGNTGEIRFRELAANGTQYTGFKAPDALTASRIWTLPVADGNAGQALKTDGNGALGWATFGTGSVTLVSTGQGLVGGPIATSGTISIPLGGVTNALMANPYVTVSTGAGLTGGGAVVLGSSLSLSIPAGGVSNAMLESPSIAVSTASPLSGGGTVALGGSLSLSLGTVGVGNGGTGATTAPAARTALGAAASGINADITGLSGLGTQAAVVVGPYGTAAGSTGEVRFLELAANGTNHVGLKAPDSLAANKVWALPSADGTAGQVVKTDGAGSLGWVSVTSGAGLTLLSAPLIKEFSFTGSQGFEVALPAGIDGTMQAILADVFVTATISDHQNIVLGREGSAQKNWVDNRGQQPSTQFGVLGRQSVTLTYPGEVDGFSSNYGTWYSSQIIPLKSNGAIQFQNYANSGSNGWVYIVIRGYFR